MLQTTIQSGFARSRSEALHPRLFPDAGWYCPSLQSPGGTRLHDLRGGNWGTLANMANNDWVVNGGKGALDFDGSDDVVSVSGFSASTAGEFDLTMSIWVRPSDATATYRYAGSRITGTFQGFQLFQQGSSYFALIDNGPTVATVQSAVAVTTNWAMVTLVRRGSGLALFVNGLQTGTPASLSGSIRSSASFEIGSVNSLNFFSGQIDDVRIYSRALTAGDVRQLWQLGRGNMPIARRRRYTEQAGFQAYWARRQSQLIGGGV